MVWREEEHGILGRGGIEGLEGKRSKKKKRRMIMELIRHDMGQEKRNTNIEANTFGRKNHQAPGPMRKSTRFSATTRMLTYSSF
jgi:hypothetical protein